MFRRAAAMLLCSRPLPRLRRRCTTISGDDHLPALVIKKLEKVSFGLRGLELAHESRINAVGFCHD
jgi:hypothetical protein